VSSGALIQLCLQKRHLRLPFCIEFRTLPGQVSPDDDDPLPHDSTRVECRVFPRVVSLASNTQIARRPRFRSFRPAVLRISKRAAARLPSPDCLEPPVETIWQWLLFLKPAWSLAGFSSPL